MRIERASPEAVRFVALNMRARDFDEFSALSPLDDREALAGELAARYGRRPDVVCVGDEAGPICVVGTIEAWPTVVTLLFFATDRLASIVLPATRFVLRELFPRYDRIGIRRIQAVAMADRPDVDRWLRMLGLEPETGPLPGYGKRGEAFIQYARVRDVRAPGR